MRRAAVLGGLLLLAGGGLAGGLLTSTPLAVAADKLKVGFVYVGPVGDFGWTYQHEVARRELAKALRDRIDTTYLENVPEGPDAERSIEQLARMGHRLIFATSFGYMDPTIRVAKKYPKVFFEHASGYKRAANVSTYSGRFYEGSYIQGVIAAKMSKTGVLGYIAPFPIPEVISGINATMLGAQTVNPEIRMKIVWASTWFDPGKEADAATALVGGGADVLMQLTDSPAAMQVAARHGIYAFGQSSDMIRFGPKSQLTAIVENWVPYYVRRVNEVLAGTWKPTDTWDGLDSQMVLMAPYTNMPDDVKNLAMNTEAAIKAATLHPYRCPITDQFGKTVNCLNGDHLDDGQILSMNFFVKGIEDAIPGATAPAPIVIARPPAAVTVVEAPPAPAPTTVPSGKSFESDKASPATVAPPPPAVAVARPLAPAPAIAPAPPPERRVALLIGNSNYLNFPKIPNPQNDATDLAAALKNLGFDVLLGTDLKRAEMEDIFIRFARKARESDTALVFYAGHGLQYQGINYLAPVDARLDDETDLRKLVNLQDVIGDLQSAGHVRILIVDACRDNEAVKQLASRLPATRSAAFSRGLAAVSGADGTLIAFATQPNRVAADGQGRNSPFTQALLKNLPTPGLELRTLMTRVRAEVVNATGGTQRPEVWDSLVGEFAFKAGQ